MADLGLWFDPQHGMTATLASLHPNPGWPCPDRPCSEDPSSDQTSNGCDSPDAAPSPVGKHCILELYGCNPARLDDEAFLRSVISSAVQQAGATLLHMISHHFEPQGVTTLALLAESHLSIHTWPESGYAAVDVFTCGDHTMPERACGVLCRALGARDQRLHSFRRETPEAIHQQQRTPG